MLSVKLYLDKSILAMMNEFKGCSYGEFGASSC